MRIANFGHSCILVELDGKRVLFDPGTFAHGFEGLTDLDAIAVTHQHPDHIDPERIGALIEANPQARLLSDPQTAQQRGEGWEPVSAGQIVELGGDVQLTGGGGYHAVIHPDLPVIDNTVYQLGTAADPAQLVHPGDSLWVPPVPVGVLAIPAAAPWLRIWDAVDYLRAVNPRTAIPIHYGIIEPSARGIYFGRLSEMAPAGTEFRVIDAEDQGQF
ncbi:MBL fold metallo-hydrolase [Nocardia camponoti]|uniref:MBL fold metallo-hydrolase n=1 Tax=Nocardia camponoti TaxID=1616106 RepID=A0A917VAX5_9NOCA|nr:MBL fold metallo-hydrolase [Nocardia camponoti]GGK59264.1 MBL fold metallo-hydrolase [Nocardia camponoti]